MRIFFFFLAGFRIYFLDLLLVSRFILLYSRSGGLYQQHSSKELGDIYKCCGHVLERNADLFSICLLFQEIGSDLFYTARHHRLSLESHFLIDATIAEIIFGVLSDRCVTENVTRASPLGNCNVQNL